MAEYYTKDQSDLQAFGLGVRIKAYVAGLVAPKNVFFDQIWGEESGNFSASTASGYQYSYGNGETGQTGGVAVYIPPGYTAEIVAMTFCAKGTSVGVVDVVINGAQQGVDMAVSTTANAGNSFDLPSPIALSQADKITFRTKSATSASDGNVATAVIKFTET